MHSPSRMEVRKVISVKEEPTAASASFPRNCPTIRVSAILQHCCRRFPRIMGTANSSMERITGPRVRSLFMFSPCISILRPLCHRLPGEHKPAAVPFRHLCPFPGRCCLSAGAVSLPPQKLRPFPAPAAQAAHRMPMAGLPSIDCTRGDEPWLIPTGSCWRG